MAGKKKEVAVSPEELVNAALNVPEPNTVRIADKVFYLKDFKYKDYIVFIKYLAPMFDLFLTGNKRSFSIGDSGSQTNAIAIIEFCENDLPKMGLMVAHNSYPEMTEDELLDLIPSPFELAELVLAQIAHNRIVEKLAGFLQLMTPTKRV